MFTHSSPQPCTNIAVNDVNTRLNWLIKENETEAQSEKLFRSVQEKTNAELMLRPVNTQRAYGILGLALGTFPPAAIFIKMFGNNFSYRSGEETIVIFLLVFAMNLVCALTGYGMGLALGKSAFSIERSSWTKMFLLFPLLALAWGIVTGAAGGIIFFGFGALIGPLFAIPVSLVGFLVFAILHRLIENGGMIERKHLLPLAFGTSLTISAFILGV